MRGGLNFVAAILCPTVLSLSGHALAQSGSNHYTGCLDRNGRLTQLEPGDDPRRHCRKRSTQVTLQGEDPEVGTETGVRQG